MKHFVHFNDDYADNGGIGFKEFDTEGQAITFIEGRISEDPTSRSLKDYTLIQGRVKCMKVVETVKHIKVV